MKIQIENLELDLDVQQLKNLKRQLAEIVAEHDKPLFWEPKYAEKKDGAVRYWFLGEDRDRLTNSVWHDDYKDRFLVKNGNCFEYSEEAQAFANWRDENNIELKNRARFEIEKIYRQKEKEYGCENKSKVWYLYFSYALESYTWSRDLHNDGNIKTAIDLSEHFREILPLVKPYLDILYRGTK
jgi:hypothetical protein